MRTATIIRVLFLPAILALAAFIYTSCSPPPIGVNLPFYGEGGDLEFNSRIQTRFPVGSLERDLVNELRREGFKPGEGDSSNEHVWTYQVARFPCEIIWNVVWASDSTEHLTLTKGMYGSSCL